MAIAIGGLAKAVGDFGVSAMVVQRESLESSFLRAAFTVTVGVFICLAFCQVVISPLGGLVLGDQRVVGVIIALALALPVQGLASFFLALLRRDLAFSQVAKLNVLAVVVASIVACSLAFAGYGVWSLVAAQIVSPAVVALVAFRFAPQDVRLDLAATKRWRRDILDFGRFATGNSIINYLVHNLDYLVIGRILPTPQLGFYFFAFEKSRILSRRVLDLYSGLAFPVFSRLKQDAEQMRRAYRTATAAAVILIAPAVAFLAFNAELVIPLVFGDQWTPSVTVFQILSIHVIVNAVTSGIGSVFYAVGRPDIPFRIVRWIVVPLGLAYFVGAKISGIIGVAIAVAVIKSLFSMIKLTACFRFLHWELLPTLRPALIAIVGAILGGVVSRRLPAVMPFTTDWGEFAGVAVVFCAVFGFSQVVLNRNGLTTIWNGLLGARELEWCRHHLPGSLCSLLAIPG